MKGKSTLHDTVAALASKLGTFSVSIVTMATLAWCLGPSDRGSYAVCRVFASLLAVLFAVGCDAASVYLVASKRISLAEGISCSLVFSGVCSSLAILAGLGILALPLEFLTKAEPDSFLLSLVLIPVSLTSLVLLGLLRAIGEFRIFAFMSIAGAGIRLAFVLVFVIAFSWKVQGALLAEAAGGALHVLAMLLLFRWKFAVATLWPSTRAVWDMFHYGIRYYFGKLSNSVNAYSGTLILALLATKEEIGFFAVATQLGLQLLFIPDTLTAVLQPRIAANTTQNSSAQVAQCVRFTAVLSILFSFVLFTFAEPIVVMLFSPAFAPAVVLVRIVAIGVLFRCPSKVFVPYFLGIDRPGIASSAVLVGMIVNLSTMLLLYSAIGVPAAALGLTMGYVAGSAVLTVGFLSLSSMNVRQILTMTRADWTVVEGIASRIVLRVATVFR